MTFAVVIANSVTRGSSRNFSERTSTRLAIQRRASQANNPRMSREPSDLPALKNPEKVTWVTKLSIVSSLKIHLNQWSHKSEFEDISDPAAITNSYDLHKFKGYFQSWHHLCFFLDRRPSGVKKKTVQSGLSGNRQNWMNGSSRIKSNLMNHET